MGTIYSMFEVPKELFQPIIYEEMTPSEWETDLFEKHEEEIEMCNIWVAASEVMESFWLNITHECPDYIDFSAHPFDFDLIYLTPADIARMLEKIQHRWTDKEIHKWIAQQFKQLHGLTIEGVRSQEEDFISFFFAMLPEVVAKEKGLYIQKG